MKSKKELIVIQQARYDFDAACSDANKLALKIFQIDESGNSQRPDWVRSENCLKIKFITCETTLSMVSREYEYHFEAWIE